MPIDDPMRTLRPLREAFPAPAGEPVSSRTSGTILTSSRPLVGKLVLHGTQAFPVSVHRQPRPESANVLFDFSIINPDDERFPAEIVPDEINGDYFVAEQECSPAFRFGEGQQFHGPIGVL